MNNTQTPNIMNNVHPFILEARAKAALKAAECFALEYSKARAGLTPEDAAQMFEHVQELDAAAMNARNAWHAARAVAARG